MARDVPLQNRLPRGGPGAKTIRLVLLSTFCSVVAVGAVALHISYEQLRRSIDDTVPVALEWSRERLLGRVAGLAREVKEIADSRALRERAASKRPSTSIPPDGDPSIASALADALEGSPAVDDVFFLDGEGNTRATVGAGSELQAMLQFLEQKNAVEAELVEVMRSAAYREELVSVEPGEIRSVDLATAPPFLLASAPVFDLAGRRVGSVHATVGGGDFANLLRADLLGGGNLFLVDARGQVVAATGDGGEIPERLARPLLEVRREPEAVFLWDGHPVMVVTDAIHAGVLDWMLVARQTPVVATGRLLLALLQIGAVGVCAVAFFTFLASAAARRMTRRLETLFDAMHRLSRGDLSVEISDKGVHGQFAALFRIFNAATKRQREKSDDSDSNLRSLVEQNLAFQRQNDMLSTLSVTDGLTGLHNHRYFKEQLNREIKRQQRTREALALLIIDIDDFKQLNDRFGHAAGDEFLKQFARILEELVRDTDILARYGGEEFVVLATGTDTLGAATLAEKLRTRVAETSFIVDASMRPRRVTVSVGVALYKHSPSEMFRAADAALYRAKSAGKNCVVFDDETPIGG